MREDVLYDVRLIDDGDHPQPPTAVTDQGIDFIDMLEELTPALAHEAGIGPEDDDLAAGLLSATANDVGVLSVRDGFMALRIWQEATEFGHKILSLEDPEVRLELRVHALAGMIDDEIFDLVVDQLGLCQVGSSEITGETLEGLQIRRFDGLADEY